MILTIFILIGALWGVSGIILQAIYWGRMPLSGTLVFILIGGSIIAAVNRWWILADWNDELLMYLAAAGILGAWIAAIYLVRTYIAQQGLLEDYFHDTDDDQ